VRLGFHISIAGGLERVRERAESLGCDTIQLFSRSPRGWRSTPLKKSEAESFRVDMAAAGIAPVVVHAPYLLNLATEEPMLRRRTITALALELKRAALIGAQYVVVHVGRNPRVDEAEAIRLVGRAVDATLKQTPGRSVRLLLENTAGMKGDVGSWFEGIAAIIAGLAQPDRVGVCLDTAHLFGAGYDLRTRAAVDAVVREFDRVVGFGRLCLLHLNDTKVGLGDRKDRHWHIGQGKIGRAGFGAILGHALLGRLPGIMETPRKTDGDDARNMRALRRLEAGGR
jgi:deoxyribonuclease-4